MDMWCKTCDAFTWAGDGLAGHKCHPAWLVYDPENDGWDSAVDAAESLGPIYAADAQAAAERWGDEMDSEGDYPIAGGETPMVCVLPYGQVEAEPEYFTVSAEHLVEYSARACEGPEKTATTTGYQS